ncbi:MAG: hypothetical protein SFU25_08440 [Candidatus Caenarcaniphilales bacterium]|nr:hypothetical protein [Candidatus Caenarcaniphilales bacterium]
MKQNSKERGLVHQLSDTGYISYAVAKKFAGDGNTFALVVTHEEISGLIDAINELPPDSTLINKEKILGSLKIFLEDSLKQLRELLREDTNTLNTRQEPIKNLLEGLESGDIPSTEEIRSARKAARLEP